MCKRKTPSFIVVSSDGKWFATGRNSFTDVRDLAVRMSEAEADDIISSIHELTLIKEAA